MFYQWSEESHNNLITCKPELILLANIVLLKADCKVLWGFRDKREQEKAFRDGKSKLHFPYSMHNRYPSSAIDLAPYPIDWSDIRRFYYFGGYVTAVAHRLGIKIRWGGDWDGDFQVKDQNFNDLVHFELIRSNN